jgi:hypothetical protein
MGVVSSTCPCLEGFLGYASDRESVATTAKYAFMIRGSGFLKPQFMGLSTVEVKLTLSENLSTLRWVTGAATSWGSGERGAIDIATLGVVKAEGKQGLLLIGKDKVELLNVVAETTDTRDRWVERLIELQAASVMNPMPVKVRIGAGDTSDKAAYFAKRESEICERERLRDEKRKKYAAGGMKYTAIAMASRCD